jgi:microsomal dipeptidase-like Zn-dependent dipeptidase
MIADLHVHYPMRVVQDLTPRTTERQVHRILRRLSLAQWAEASFIGFLNRFINARSFSSGYRVTIDALVEGRVGVVLSALYRPLQEMDLSKGYQAPPDPEYFALLLSDLVRVEEEVGAHDDRLIRVVRSPAQLDAARADGAIALVHCVEGGFHLGDTPERIAANVATLAARGVAYVTLAHLFYRGVATNAPALPFLKTDADYDRLFPQPAGVGLSPLGEAAVRAMVEHGTLIDVSHMGPEAFWATLELLDALDSERRVPVIASHAGFRFGGQRYLLDAGQLGAIRDRDGVVGLILAQHQLNDGLHDGTVRRFEQGKDIIFRHVDAIAEATGGHDHLALGSDLDGFIKPTMAGIEDCGDLRKLEDALREHLAASPGAAEKVTHGNALRVLRAGWRGAP